MSIEMAKQDIIQILSMPVAPIPARNEDRLGQVNALIIRPFGSRVGEMQTGFCIIVIWIR